MQFPAYQQSRDRFAGDERSLYKSGLRESKTEYRREPRQRFYRGGEACSGTSTGSR